MWVRPRGPHRDHMPQLGENPELRAIGHSRRRARGARLRVSPHTAGRTGRALDPVGAWHQRGPGGTEWAKRTCKWLLFQTPGVRIW